MRRKKINVGASEKIGLFSGGKDSLVACLVAQVKEVIYCRTGVGLNEDYVKEICNRFNWKLNIVEPAPNETYEIFVKRFSFPHPAIHKIVMAFLKFHPIRKWHSQQKKLGRNIIFISGIRKAESAIRKRRYKTPTNVMDNMTFFKPILDWSTVQVWTYLKDNNIQRSPTYETLHVSGDCICGAFSGKGESAFLKMFHPELAKRFLELEKKYGGKWGNQISLSDMEHQKTFKDFDEELICQECKVQE